MGKYKTSHDAAGLQWHLEHNVTPVLTKRTIEGLLNLVSRFNKGELSLDDNIPSGVTDLGVEITEFTIGEMFEDLKIEVEPVDKE